jgi:cell division protein FtsI/penicillin-binding protein 2
MGVSARTFVLCLCLAAPLRAQQQPSSIAPSHSLFSQSAAETLQKQFANSAASYLLLDARSGAVLASNWENYDKPIPMGSLVKPFTAIAYAGTHDFRYPIYECKGKSTGCWQEHPHSKLDIVAAVSVSCNSYFRRLAESVTLEQLAPVTQEFHLELPDSNSTGGNLIGLGTQWRVSPLHLAQAYLELYRRKEQPGVAPLLEGMRQSALRGTGAAVDRQLKPTNALVKTGTAPCTHARWAPADGFTLSMVPADNPEILLLIRVHSVAGVKAAETAGQMLRRTGE